MTAPALRVVEAAVTPETLQAYAQVSIAFRVESRLRVDLVDGGLGGVRLVEEPVAPYTKDYDEYEPDAPLRWLRWVTRRCSLFVAYEGERRVGGACVVSHAEGMEFLRRRLDTAALWDIRVAPEARGRGVGAALFAAATAWCRRHGYRRLKIETQNVNVAACRFYAAQGCYLGAIERHAYLDFPDEVELVWYYDLASAN